MLQTTFSPKLPVFPYLKKENPLPELKTFQVGEDVWGIFLLPKQVIQYPSDLHHTRLCPVYCPKYRSKSK